MAEDEDYEENFDNLLDTYVNNKSRDNTVNSNRANTRTSSAKMKAKMSISDVK